MSERHASMRQVVVSGEAKRPWIWLFAGVVIGAALTFVTLRVLQETINEPPPKAA